MSNMSYCRFANTLPDLADCAEALDDIDGDISQLNEDEQPKAKRLIALCKKIAEKYGEKPPLVQIASDIMGACMNGDLDMKWEDVADCLVKNDFDGLVKLVSKAA